MSISLDNVLRVWTWLFKLLKSLHIPHMLGVGGGGEEDSSSHCKFFNHLHPFNLITLVFLSFSHFFLFYSILYFLFSVTLHLFSWFQIVFFCSFKSNFGLQFLQFWSELLIQRKIQGGNYLFPWLDIWIKFQQKWQNFHVNTTKTISISNP